MPGASFAQSSFLGGEWSKYAQGRFDKASYATAMNTCFNTIPLEEGAATRRPGERFLATTRNGSPGRLIAFDFEASAPYNIELTDGHLRFFGSMIDGPMALVTVDNEFVTNISTASPAVVTVLSPRTWVNDDQGLFLLDNVPAAFVPTLKNRVFSMVRLTSTTFAIYDPVTGAPIDGTELNWGSGPGAGANVILALVSDKVSPYIDGQWADVRSIQSDQGAILLHGTYRPRLVSEFPATIDRFAGFSLSIPTFLDGPYLDPLDLTATPGGTSGAISFIIPASALFTFAATDVGRAVRIFSEPDAWDGGTSYASGDQVAFNDGYYIALASSTGVQPDTAPMTWGVSASATRWTWGTITAFTDAQTVTVTIAGDDLLYANTINIWQVGVFSDTTGWPTCGTYHEGRLWLSGAIPNRIDSSKSNDIFNFAPTAPDGAVADNNGISYTFNATDTNAIFWMQPTSQGIVCGTQGGEWLIQASALNDPLTPTSIQAHRVTKYGCANIEPRETGLTLVFVQRWTRKVFEYFPDVLSSRFMAPNLSLNAAHITHDGVAEIAFQKERTPIIWARTKSNKLAGVTYKRDSLMSSQAPEYVGWHRHALGSCRSVTSICVGPSQFANLDGLSMVTKCKEDDIHHVGILTDFFDEEDVLTSAWFLDNAIVPAGGVVDVGANTITLHGLWHLNGKTVSIFALGLDCGDGTVSNGAVTISLGDGIENLFSLGYIKKMSGSTVSNAPGAVALTTNIDIPVLGSTTDIIERFEIPVIVGFPYTSQGQCLRRVAPQEAGAANGPALGKIQRTHQFTALIVNAVSNTVSFGTSFDHLRAAGFRTKGNKPYENTQLFSGVHQDTLDDEYGYDSMICWEISRPLPLTMAAFGGFLNTQDR